MTIIFWVESTLGCDSICQIATELQPRTCRTRGHPARALTAARQSAVRRAAACRPRATLRTSEACRFMYYVPYTQ